MEHFIEMHREDPAYDVQYSKHLGQYIFVNRETRKWFSFSHTPVGIDKKWG